MGARRASCKGEPSKLKPSLSLTVGWVVQTDTSINQTIANSVTRDGAPTSAIPSFFDAHDLCDHLGRGA